MLNVQKSLLTLKNNTLLLSKKHLKNTLYLIIITLYFYLITISSIFIYIKEINS